MFDLIEYCKPFFLERKVFFAKIHKLFHKPPRWPKHRPHRTGDCRKYRAHRARQRGKSGQYRSAEQQKIARRPKPHSRQKKQPKQPLPAVKPQKQQRKQNIQRKGRVRHAGRPCQTAANCPKKVVNHAQRDAKSKGERKLCRL